MAEREKTRGNKVVRNEKGQIISGTPNPYGRPKGAGISITTAIKRELEKRPRGSDKATYLNLLVKRILKNAIQEGDQQTIKQIWNYVDGMPQQSIELGGKVDLSILENSLREISNESITVENSKDGESNVQGRNGETNDTNGKPVPDVPIDIQEALQ